MRQSLCITGVLAIMLACTRIVTEDDVSRLRFETVCDLHENMSLTGNIYSFAIIDSSSFVVSSRGDDNPLIIYDMGGRQRRIIGRHGKARYEYINPAIIKVKDDKIYVWCDMLTKFIVYGLDGTPLAEFRYSSAIRDFIPYKDKIVIYGGSNPGGSIISIYDTLTQTIVKTTGIQSQEHSLLAVNHLPSPFCIDDDTLYYSPIDKICIRKLSLLNDGLDMIELAIDPESFEVSRLRDHDIMNKNREKAFRYLNENSSVIGLQVIDTLFAVKTVEGTLDADFREVKNIDRHYSMYFIDRESGRYIQSVQSLESVYDPVLSDFYGNTFYQVNNTVADSKDNYSVCSLKYR